MENKRFGFILMELHLRRKPCADCPFHGGIELTPEYMSKIVNYLSKGVNHICHTTNTHVCHGGRELQLKMFVAQGKIKEPTNESLFEAMRELGIEPAYTYED